MKWSQCAIRFGHGPTEDIASGMRVQRWRWIWCGTHIFNTHTLTRSSCFIQLHKIFQINTEQTLLTWVECCACCCELCSSPACIMHLYSSNIPFHLNGWIGTHLQRTAMQSNSHPQMSHFHFDSVVQAAASLSVRSAKIPIKLMYARFTR